jgi:CD2 antigen cytoplasmic tail-binding protein 2
MAQTKRAAKRKGGPSAVADTDLVDDVQRVEEDLEIEEEDGIKLEAFNLKEERQKGYFDAETGNYVENEQDEEADATDAWLASDEAKTVDAKTLEKIKEQQRRLAEAEAAAPLTAVQIARLQWQISKILKPGETVAGGLKRLGGAIGQHRRPIGKRANKRNKSEGKDDKTTELSASVPDPKDKEHFDQLTEASSALVDSGETEVYGQDKNYFERCAAVYIDIDEGPPNILAQGVGTAAYEDADEDMFAEDDEKGDGGKKKEEKKETAMAVETEAGAAAGKGNEVDYSRWPIKELRRFLTERRVDTSGIVEKGELVAKVKEAAAVAGGNAGGINVGKVAGETKTQAPAGYVLDPSSGMWHSTESGMYWDSNSGGFYNPGDEKWYSFNSADGQWIEWANVT